MTQSNLRIRDGYGDRLDVDVTTYLYNTSGPVASIDIVTTEDGMRTVELTEDNAIAVARKIIQAVTHRRELTSPTDEN